jgi:hypothetical protein
MYTNILLSIPQAILLSYVINKMADIIFNNKGLSKMEEEYYNIPMYIQATKETPGARRIRKNLLNQHKHQFTYATYGTYGSTYDEPIIDDYIRPIDSLNHKEKEEDYTYAIENPERSKYHTMKTEMRIRFMNKKFIFLLVAGILGIIVSALVIQYKTASVAAGIGIGSIITLMYAIGINWHNTDEFLKLILSLFSLLSLAFVGYKFFGK